MLGLPVGGRPACSMDQQGQPCTQRTCDAQNRTECLGYVGQGQSCREASCTAGVATFAAACNGKGACPAAETQECQPYVCNGKVCGKDFCESDAQCNAKFRCAIAQGAKKGGCLPKLFMLLLPFAAVGAILFPRS